MKKKTVNIPETLHQKIKIEVARRKEKVSGFVERACRKELKKNN